MSKLFNVLLLALLVFAVSIKKTKKLREQQNNNQQQQHLVNFEVNQNDQYSENPKTDPNTNGQQGNQNQQQGQHSVNFDVDPDEEYIFDKLIETSENLDSLLYRVDVFETEKNRATYER